MSPKTIFITGANSGFGFAIASAAVQMGHKVIGTVRSESARAVLVEALPEACPVLCDVTEFERLPAGRSSGGGGAWTG
jgi:NAD(P)-dependent dehydrogenase (short-subunit alcohol dehydrogenase family)